MSFYHREILRCLLGYHNYPDQLRISWLCDTFVIDPRHAYTCNRWDRARIKKERLSFPQSELLDYVDSRAWGRRSSETSNVSKFERAVQYISTDGKAARSTTIEPSPRVPSSSLCRTMALALSWRAHDARPRWVPLRSSSTGVPRRPQRSQGEGTSHAPAMSEESTPLRRGVHTLTRPISIRA